MEQAIPFLVLLAVLILVFYVMFLRPPAGYMPGWDELEEALDDEADLVEYSRQLSRLLEEALKAQGQMIEILTLILDALKEEDKE